MDILLNKQVDKCARHPAGWGGGGEKRQVKDASVFTIPWQEDWCRIICKLIRRTNKGKGFVEEGEEEEESTRHLWDHFQSLNSLIFSLVGGFWLPVSQRSLPPISQG